MHDKQKITCLAWAGLFALALLAGCGSGEETEAGLDYEDLVEVQPGAVPPRIKFPAEWQQEDPSVNEFVSNVLDICQRGNYDKFCSLFGINEVPPSHDDFQRIWGGVSEVAVRSIHPGPQDPPQYFVHAVVKLRKPDAQKRLQRDIVVRIFKELNEWRISGASKEIIRKVLIADSQPASAPAAGTHSRSTRPSGQATTRPALGPRVQPAGQSAAPSSRPAVYKDKSQGS